MKNNDASSSMTRFGEIDVMKGIAITLVVLGHVLAWFYADFLERFETMSYNEVVLWKYIYSFHMPLFMFVSGFVAFNPAKKYQIDKVGKRCLSYLIPLLIFGLLCSLYREEFNAGNIVGQYWYFKTLSIFLLILYGLEVALGKIKINRTFSDILIAILFSIITICLSMGCKRCGGALNLIVDSSHLDWNFFYFILGWYLRREEKLYRLCKHDICFVLCFILMIVHVVYPKNVYIVFPIAAIIFTLHISDNLAKGKMKAFIVNLGKRTKDIYILHFFFMLKVPDIGLYFAKIAPLGIAPSLVLQALAGIPTCLVITFLCYKIGFLLNRNKYISRYFFGYL